LSTTAVGALAFVGGVAVGLLIAKLYVRSKLEDAIGSGLTSLGLSQSTATGIAQGISPVVTG
jgi:hypothetical protein